MEYTKLPPVKEDKQLIPSHFPNRFYGAIFRLWETVSAENLAKGLGVETSVIEKAASDMGLPRQRYIDSWEKRGYITTIRNAWHILPYDQLLAVLGWDEDRLANVLKEDDFLFVKLGFFKPYSEPVRYEPLTKEGKSQLGRIKSVMERYFADYTGGAAPFDFFRRMVNCPKPS